MTEQQQTERIRRQNSPQYNARLESSLLSIKAGLQTLSREVDDMLTSYYTAVEPQDD